MNPPKIKICDGETMLIMVKHGAVIHFTPDNELAALGIREAHNIRKPSLEHRHLA